VALIGLYVTANGHPVSGAVGDTGAMAIFIQPLYQLLALFVPLNENMALQPTASPPGSGSWSPPSTSSRSASWTRARGQGIAGRESEVRRLRDVFFFLALMTLFYDGWFLFAMLVFLLGLKHPAP
jgi:hypothetical protein